MERRSQAALWAWKLVLRVIDADCLSGPGGRLHRASQTDHGNRAGQDCLGLGFGDGAQVVTAKGGTGLLLSLVQCPKADRAAHGCTSLNILRAMQLHIQRVNCVVWSLYHHKAVWKSSLTWGGTLPRCRQDKKGFGSLRLYFQVCT